MKVISKSEETVRIETFIIEYKGFPYTYMDYINVDTNKCIDTIIRDEGGTDVESNIYHEILQFVEELPMDS